MYIYVTEFIILLISISTLLKYLLVCCYHTVNRDFQLGMLSQMSPIRSQVHNLTILRPIRKYFRVRTAANNWSLPVVYQSSTSLVYWLNQPESVAEYNLFESIAVNVEYSTGMIMQCSCDHKGDIRNMVSNRRSDSKETNRTWDDIAVYDPKQKYVNTGHY